MHFGFLALDYPTAESGGGVGSQIRVLARTLVQAGHRATVVALRENGAPARAQDEGVEVHRVSPGNLHWYLSRIPGMNSLIVTAIRELEYSKAVWSAVRTIQKSEPFDLLEGTETGSVCAALLGKKVPLVIRLHGDPFTFYKYTPAIRITVALRLSRMIQRIALRHSRVLISPSFSHKREISAELHGAHPPIEIIPNTISAVHSGVSAAPVCPVLQAILDADGPLALYVGRIEKCKGIPALLEAAARVHKAMPECRFVLAGARHSTLRRQDIEDQLDRLGIRGAITFLGHVPHEHLARLYARATVSVVPSHYETFGLAALESMRFGVPVVASAAGSLPEIVLDGVTGLLAPPGDVEALAQAILRVLTDRETRERLSRNARERAQRYLVDEQVPRNLELYERATPVDLHGAPASEHIFFSAHPDDVVLSCGGFIASLARGRGQVRVVTVFAGAAGQAAESAYSQHLRAKWGFTAQRRQEDLRALKTLGVNGVEHWDFADAPWRFDASGRPLYSCYDELCGEVAAGDAATADSLLRFVEISAKASPSAVLYFPLSIGGHVDHRHLFRIGVRLRANGRRVRFYEDWPYAESHTPSEAAGWFWRTVHIDPNDKVAAIGQYESQMPGLGGESEELRRRIERFTRQRGVRDAAERYWELSTTAASRIDSGEAELTPPFARSTERPRLRDFIEFARTLSWRELHACLPVGRGACVDVGCGAGRHRSLIEKLGYNWIGVDRRVSPAGETLCADGQALPLASRSVAAMVAWQVLEYAPKPEAVFAEAARVLEIGGVFCGSVSFLEPVHGRTYFGISALALRELLEQNGFKDIRILPGLSTFSLTAWTWMRRFAGPWAGRLALPLAAAIQAPLMAARFLVSWVTLRLHLGTGHGMRWVAKDAPVEFAGQLVFVARKSSRPAQ